MTTADFFEATLNSVGENDFAWIGMYTHNPLACDDTGARLYRAKRVERTIKNIANVVGILSPWQAPAALGQVGCLWELTCAQRYCTNGPKRSGPSDGGGGGTGALRLLLPRSQQVLFVCCFVC